MYVCACVCACLSMCANVRDNGIHTTAIAVIMHYVHPYI